MRTELEFKISILLLPIVEEESPNNNACRESNISACDAMLLCIYYFGH